MSLFSVWLFWGLPFISETQLRWPMILGCLYPGVRGELKIRLGTMCTRASMVSHWAFESQADHISQRRIFRSLVWRVLPWMPAFRSRVGEGGWDILVSPSVFNQVLWPEYTTHLVSVDPLQRIRLQSIGKERRRWHPTPVLLPGKSHGRRSLVVCSPWVAKSRTRPSDFTFSFHFHALEKKMATRSSVLAWRIPRTEEPGGLRSMGSHRVGHDWSDLAAAAAVARKDIHPSVPTWGGDLYTLLPWQ